VVEDPEKVGAAINTYGPIGMVGDAGKPNLQIIALSFVSQ